MEQGHERVRGIERERERERERVKERPCLEIRAPMIGE